MNNLEQFNINYQKLSERDKEKFSLLATKLINVNYLTGEKEEDTANFYFISLNFECFRSYFALINMELSLYKENKIIVLTSPNFIKLTLNKMQSAILLIIRLLYNEKLKDISLTDKIIVRIDEIRDKYEQIGIIDDEKLTPTKLLEIMRIFKRYNLINFKGVDIKQDDFLITIYKTIQYAVSINSIEELNSKINSYKEKGDLDEEIRED